MLQRLRDADGAAMLLVLLTVAILAVLGLALAEMSQAHLLLAFREHQALQALDLAEAGLHRAVAELWLNPGWSGEAGATVDGADGTYGVTIAPDPQSPAQVVATSTGTSGRVSRTVRGHILVMNTLAIGEGLMLRESLTWPGGDLDVHGATQIDGNLTVTGGRVRFYGPTTLAGRLSDPNHRVTATEPITERGTVVPPPDINPGIFHGLPWDLIDIDYPDGTHLYNGTLKSRAPFLSSLYYIAHIEGDGIIGNMNTKDKLLESARMVIIVADGSLTIDGDVKLAAGASLTVIAGGDITVVKNCDYEDTTLIASGDLVLNRGFEVTGSVTADTVISGSNDLTVTQQDSESLTLPIALQVSLLTWEEVTPP